MVRVLAVADTDSYLKWSLATLERLPAGWSTRQVLVRNVVMPSAAQVAAAGRGRPVETLGLPGLTARLVRERPDVVLLACTGPVVATLARLPVLRGARRPVLVTGLPGLSIPASDRAVRFRRACDLFLVHSHRERLEFAQVAAREAPTLGFGLARLPFLPDADLVPLTDGPAGEVPLGRAPVVFAAQARVPPERSQREAVLRALATAAPAVVKLRAAAGEQQTHREQHPYDVLWADLVARGEVEAGAVTFVTGSMADALAGARGLVTVSSTAALEAIALGRPLLVADDFGLSAEMINLVFVGSGVTGPLAGLATTGLRTPAADWRAANYFHAADDDDWLVRLGSLLARRTAGTLPVPPAGGLPGRTRQLRQLARLSLSAPGVGRADRSLTALSRGLRGLRARGRTARGRLRGRPDAAAPVAPPPAPPDGRRPPPPASPPSPADRGR